MCVCAIFLNDMQLKYIVLSTLFCKIFMTKTALWNSNDFPNESD